VPAKSSGNPIIPRVFAADLQKRIGQSVVFLITVSPGFMNKSPATTFLLVVLVISSLASVLFCGLYIRSAMRLRDVQRAMANVQAYRAAFASLLNETVEYSKRNPAVDPILEGAGL
jgi:hypothetical protein